jgi:hypothetical protein
MLGPEVPRAVLPLLYVVEYVYVAAEVVVAEMVELPNKIFLNFLYLIYYEPLSPI